MENVVHPLAHSTANRTPTTGSRSPRAIACDLSDQTLGISPVRENANPGLPKRVRVTRPLTLPQSPNFAKKPQRAARPPQPSPPKPFKAQNIPYFDEPQLPRRVLRPVTKPVEFQMPGKVIHSQAVDEWGKRVANQQVEAKEARNFRAQNIPDFTVPPQLPVVDKKELTVAETPALATKIRAPLRSDYDQRNEERIRREEQEMEEAAQLRLEQEEVQVRELRSRAVPRPTVMPDLQKVFQAKRSDKNVTIAETPACFHNKFNKKRPTAFNKPKNTTSFKAWK